MIKIEILITILILIHFMGIPSTTNTVIWDFRKKMENGGCREALQKIYMPSSIFGLGGLSAGATTVLVLLWA